MTAGAAVAGLGDEPQFRERADAASGDGRNHFLFGDVETPAYDAIRATASGATALTISGAVSVLVILHHGPQPC
jgi:hypothetical protein